MKLLFYLVCQQPDECNTTTTKKALRKIQQQQNNVEKYTVEILINSVQASCNKSTGWCICKCVPCQLQIKELNLYKNRCTLWVETPNWRQQIWTRCLFFFYFLFQSNDENNFSAIHSISVSDFFQIKPVKSSNKFGLMVPLPIQCVHYSPGFQQNANFHSYEKNKTNVAI